MPYYVTMKTKMKRTKIDMHLHTRGSDGLGTPEQIVGNALKAGLTGICITDHHKTHTAEGLKVAELARSKGLRVFRGCEYSTAQGHLLVYGIDVSELPLGYYPEMQVVIDAVNAAGGVAIPAHPFKGYKRALFDGVKKLRGVRAYETANGQCTYQKPEANKQAAKAAKDKGKHTTGGSDAHNPGDIGLTYTVFHGDIQTEKEFIHALKRGHYRAVTDRKRADTKLANNRWSSRLDTKLTPMPLIGQRERVWTSEAQDKAEDKENSRVYEPWEYDDSCDPFFFFSN